MTGPGWGFAKMFASAIRGARIVENSRATSAGGAHAAPGRRPDAYGARTAFTGRRLEWLGAEEHAGQAQ